MVLLHVFFPVNRALLGVLRRDLAVFRKHRLDADVALLLAGRGDRNVHTHQHARLERCILDLHRGADRDAIRECARLLHDAHRAVQTQVRLTSLAGALAAVQRHLRPRAEFRHGFDHTREETTENPHLAMEIDEADLTARDRRVKLLLRVRRNLRPDDVHRLRAGVREVSRHAADHLTLCQQTVAEILRQIRARESLVDTVNRGFELSAELHLLHCLRQPDIQIAEILILVHR